MKDLLSTEKISRRVFVKGLGFVSLALVMSTCGGCEDLAEQIRNRPTRRRLRTGSAEVDADIATYAQAIGLMKGLSNSDLRSWDNQAQIHGTISAGFNLCQHNPTSHFFSWHRAYLFYFEKICQELTGNKNFGLPYWNWNQDPAIHPAFLDPTSNLFMSRNNTTVAGYSAFSTSTLDLIFSDTNFFTFDDQIEVSPHNTAHGVVGQTMATGGSPLDPIFWAHHNMADYCWDKWNIELGNDNPNDPAWINTSWNHFVDAQGNPTNITAGTTTLMTLLSYQFESSAIGSNAAKAALTREEYQRVEKRLREGADIKFEIKQRIPISDKSPVTIARPFSKATKTAARDFSALLNTDKEKEKIFMNAEFASLPPTSDFFVRVFINLPDANANTSTEDPHYAGSFAFFGTHSEHSPQHNQKPVFLVNITDTLQRLRQRNDLKEDQPISIHLVAVPFSGKFERPDVEIVLEKLEIIVTPVIVKNQQR